MKVNSSEKRSNTLLTYRIFRYIHYICWFWTIGKFKSGPGDVYKFYVFFVFVSGPYIFIKYIYKVRDGGQFVCECQSNCFPFFWWFVLAPVCPLLNQCAIVSYGKCPYAYLFRFVCPFTFQFHDLVATCRTRFGKAQPWKIPGPAHQLKCHWSSGGSWASPGHKAPQLSWGSRAPQLTDQPEQPSSPILHSLFCVVDRPSAFHEFTCIYGAPQLLCKEPTETRVDVITAVWFCTAVLLIVRCPVSVCHVQSQHLERPLPDILRAGDSPRASLFRNCFFLIIDVVSSCTYFMLVSSWCLWQEPHQCYSVQLAQFIIQACSMRTFGNFQPPVISRTRFDKSLYIHFCYVDAKALVRVVQLGLLFIF